ncbi:MAG: peptidylprolyl isomerase [Gammaproteobacteria bacterium]|jgi:FKBP-type peptidyl-prolyl cis-trans isomerase SlyD|nr:peptidylprolyl isomerase [Gammaproteobacteria bacterium]MBT4494815.1 peptidylprolyl isomerase [Gammaproteobacteria bacterium]
MTIEKHSVVTIHYELKDGDGTTLDSSEGTDPLVYLHGTGSLIPGLENELEGRDTGESFSVSISPADGYGEFIEDLIEQVPLEVFGEVEKLEPGMQFKTSDPEGSRVITVKEVGEEIVTIDANHPLAGVTLNFSVTIETVRPATDEEIEHGHVH